eukprot:15124350-Alexandrium_andersonii.AAC.1
MQNPHRYKGYSRKVPALLRQAMMYSMAKRRRLLPGEALEVQGYHVYPFIKEDSDDSDPEEDWHPEAFI